MTAEAEASAVFCTATFVECLIHGTNEMRLRGLTYDELVAKGVAPSFARVLADPDGYHPDLGSIVDQVNWDYFIPEGVTEVVPLWDVNADSFVRWNRHGQTEYVWLFHDDPNWALVARSEQGIMAKLWHDWSEFQETDDECRQFADAIGFKYCDEGLAIWRDDYDRFKQWVMNLVD